MLEKLEKDPLREFKVRVNRAHYTYEYSSQFGGYVYHADITLAKQNKTVPIERQVVRERNRKTPKSSQSEGKADEKCGESEPMSTNQEGDMQIMALTGRSRFSRHEARGQATRTCAETRTAEPAVGFSQGSC